MGLCERAPRRSLSSCIHDLTDKIQPVFWSGWQIVILLCLLAFLPVSALAVTVTAHAGGSLNFGAVNVGVAPAPTATMIFTFDTGGSVTGSTLFTQGAYASDYTDAGTGTCGNPASTVYSAGDSCTVVVKFNPQGAGVRPGAVQLLKAGGTVVATGYVTGMGLAPVLGYPSSYQYFGSPNEKKSAFGLGTYQNARGVAVDAAGNIFVSNTDEHVVRQVPANGGTIGWVPSGVVVGSGFVAPEGLAIDGSGNVYVADPGRSTTQIFKIVAVNGVVNSLSSVIAIGSGFNTVHHIAMDVNGSVVVADTGNNAVKEIVARANGEVNASSAVVTLGSGFNAPWGITTDMAGNIYVGDNGNGLLKKIVAGTGGATINTVHNGLGSTSGGLAIDFNGNFLIATMGNSGTILSEIVAGTGGAAPGAINASSTMTSLYANGFVPAWDIAPNHSGQIIILDQLEIAGPGAEYNINAQMESISYYGAPTLNFDSTYDGAVSSAKSATIVNGGNAPLLFTIPGTGTNPKASYQFLLDTSAATTCPVLTPASGTPGSLAVDATCVVSAKFAPLAPNQGTQYGTLTFTDNVAGPAQTISLNGAALIPDAQILKFDTPPPAVLAQGGNAGSAIKVIVANYAGNLAFNAPFGLITLKVFGPTGTTSYTQYASGGVATFDLSSVPLNAVGSYTYVAYAWDYSGNSCTIHVTNSSACLDNATAYENVIGTSYTAPTTGTGSSSSSQSATIIFNSSTTLNSDPTKAFQVLTMGAPNLDFTYAAGGTCVAGTTYAAGQTCTVNYTFTPKYPGLRMGAIVIYDNSAPPIAISTIHLSGIGTGPMVTFPSNTTAAAVGSGLGRPIGMAVDGNGNLFVTDYSAGLIKEILAGTGGAASGKVNASSTVSTVGTGFSGPSGVAVDGAGNLFIAEYDGHSVKEIFAGTGGAAAGTVNTSSTVIPLGSGFSAPADVTVDANGNVFVADSANSAVKEIVAGGDGKVSASSTVNIVGHGFGTPYGVAVDASGNVFVADFTGPVKEIVAGTGGAGSGKVNSSSTVIAVGSGFNQPFGLAVDVNGNMYVADFSGNAVKEIVAGTGGAGSGIVNANSTVVTVSSGISSPAHVMLDPAGDIFVSNYSGGMVQELDQSDPPSLSYPATLVGATSAPQTVTVANSGNATLNFAIPNTGKNPSISTYYTLDSSDLDADCPLVVAGALSTGPLPANATCALPVTFAPVSPASGAVSGSLILTDNSLNVAGATQTVPLSGSVYVPITAFTITAYPSTVQAGYVAGFTITAMNGASVSTNYTGAVTFTTSDAKANFGFSPATYTFTNADHGAHTFTNGVYLHSVGNQTITVTDQSSSISQTSGNIAVSVGTPALISATGGSGQSAVIGAGFTNPLGVRVTDSWGNVESGVTVSFAAPASGASATLSSSGTVVTASDGTASVTATANTTTGNYSVVATYPRNNPDVAMGRAVATPQAPGNSNVNFNLTNTMAQPTITVVPSPASPITYGQAPTSLKATVSYSAGTPTGSATFSDSSSQLGSAVTLSAGAGTLAAQYYAAGAHSFSAVYSGDSNYHTAASSLAVYTVNKASSTLAGPATQPVFVLYQTAGAVPVSIAGQYSGAGITPPSGSIAYSIYLGATLISSDLLTIANGAITVPVAATLAPGTYRVALSYGGDSNYQAASPIDVGLQVDRIQPTISWTQPSPIVYGTTLNGRLNAAALNVQASVAGSYAYTATPAGGAAVAVSNSTVLAAGAYTLSVLFTPTDLQTYKTATASVALVVSKATPGDSLTSNSNPVLVQNSITLTATISSAVSTPTGSVTFLDGATSIGTGTLNASGVASLAISTLAVGTHSITAVYSGDANFTAATSSALSEQVQDFNLSISISGSGGATGVTSVTALPGGTAVYTFTLSPVGSATFPAVVTLSASGLPTGATYSFSPATLPAGSGATQVTLTVQLPQVSAMHVPPVAGQAGATTELAQNKPASKLPLLALALLLLPFGRKLRRASRLLGRTLTVLLLFIAGLAALAGLSGCSLASGYFGQAPKTYTVTVTGTSGVLVHSTSVTLTVE